MDTRMEKIVATFLEKISLASIKDTRTNIIPKNAEKICSPRFVGMFNASLK
jgi:hypothetical protein